MKAPAPYTKNNTIKGGMQVDKELWKFAKVSLQLVVKVLMLIGVIIGVIFAIKGVL